MNYKLKWELPHDATTCLGWLLGVRGVENIEGYVYPSKDYELNPRLLDNIDDAVKLLKKHLDNDSSILIVQDADTDGICSAAMMWLYIKDFYPNAKLEYICHEHKAHGLDDIIDDVEESLKLSCVGDEVLISELTIIDVHCIDSVASVKSERF